jgi:hypothetical protein
MTGTSSVQQEHSDIPTADPLLTSQLSLVLEAVPHQVIAGREVAIRGTITNAGAGTFSLEYDGFIDVLIWDERLPVVVGGVVAWRSGMGRSTDLPVNKSLSVQGRVLFTVYRLATEHRRPARPLPPGPYRLQGCSYLYYHHPTKHRRVAGWLLSPFVPVVVTH